jgi:hypothetical protein
MANQIVNAAPMVIEQGIQDLSTRVLPREAENIPQHLPKFYVFARKGLPVPELVSGSERDQIFGAETWDLTQKYANHATVFANLVNAEGNACMIQRIIPEDAADEANLLLSLDILPTKIDQYQRNNDGSLFYDSLGRPVILKDGANVGITTDGYKVKWVLTNKTDISLFGTSIVSEGDQVDPVTNVKSTRYPIFELKVTSKGEHGNLSGIRLYAPTTASIATMPTKLMNDAEVYPYFISVIRKPDANTSPKLISTVMGENKVMISFKPNTVDPLTGIRLYAGEKFLDSYQNLTDLRYPKQYGDFNKIHVYDNNIETILDLFFASEMPFFDSPDTSDFRLGPDSTYVSSQKHLINFVSFVQSNNAPYYSLKLLDDATSIRLTDLTNLYAKGGSDGTMNNAVFNNLVAKEVAEYANPMSHLQDLAVNVESVIYDSGFDLITKKALIDFISIRKDTFVLLSTHTDGDDLLDADQERSIAARMRTYLDNYPESDYFGTPVTRGLIMGRSAKLRNSLYTKRLPLLAEVAIKSARYMGAANGAWKTGYHFDGAPGSVIDYMYDINITWVPASVRNRIWDQGLNFALAYDRRSFFFPALKTVYADDTSVLNSYFTAMVCCHLNKVASKTWREFSGVSHLTNAQLAQRVNDFFTAEVAGKFDGRYVIRPKAYFTDMDLLRGFSFSLPVQVFSPNMKTVMTTSVQVYRIEDLQQTAA